MPNNNQISHYFSGLAIWEHFKNHSETTIENIAMVEAHINKAMPLLDYFTNSFPKYTLHNNFHQKNILKLMGELLGSDVQRLSSLECAMLILSTIYHDIGMVYTKQELEEISTEPDFNIFLKENVKAQLEFEENNRKSTQGIIEWYCRWMHAKRVWVYLNKHNVKEPLMWGNVSIKESLGYLCESHNYTTKEIIRDSEIFKTNYLGKCDLLFCAILLRLADILDFDSTRSPKSVYEFLDLGNPKNKLDSVSKMEWDKHLSSNGFEFVWEDNELKILFSATTPHPNIEVAIKEFISIINAELISCKRLLKYCSEKWRYQTIPDEINIDNLSSENYQSGSYHFSLSEDKILTLLAGDGLYDDEFIFIRELLQNAIDSSRHREFYEQQSNSEFKVQPIEVSYFTDSIGYHWIRIDDFGMGMNEEVIRNHLLKKGESYYQSDKFKLEKIKIQRKLDKDFVPISRFGIGLLSCFMAGDRIEISTLHRTETGNAFRLGIEGRNSQYVLQSSIKRHVPLPMPSELQRNEQYRTIPGTSIAVRITTNKEFIGFDMKKELEKSLFCSPVPVIYQYNKIGGNPETILEKPWGKSELIALSEDFVKEAEETFKIKFEKGINIQIENINITDRSLSTNLKGQMIVIAVDANYSPIKYAPNIEFMLSRNEQDLRLHISRKGNDPISGEEIDIKIGTEVPFLMEKIKIPERSIYTPDASITNGIYMGLSLSHNGIVLQDTSNVLALNRNLNDRFSTSGFSNFSFLYSGTFYFQDELLPELSVSRNNIKGLPFDLIANLSFALEPLNKYFQHSIHEFSFFNRTHPETMYTSADVIKSGFYEKNREYLNKYVKIDTEKGLLSIEELLKNCSEPIKIRPVHYFNHFYRVLIYFIIEQNFEVSSLFDKNEGYCLVAMKRINPFPKELLGFSPLTFVTFDPSEDKLSIGQKLNLNHPFIHWYIKAADLLNSEYAYYAKQLIYSACQSYIEGNIEAIQNILKRLELVLDEDMRPKITINRNDFN